MEPDLNATIVHVGTKMVAYTIQSSVVVGLVKRQNPNQVVGVVVVAVVGKKETETEV